MDKPLPIPTDTSLPFWEALRDQRVSIQYSPSTDQWVFYPRVLTPGSLADDLEWRTIAGTGTVYTYTVSHRPTSPEWADSVPQFLAVVEFDEGPRCTTELVNVEAADITIGMAVKPVFCDEGAITMLRFEPA
jgi:uncharacterized OB-fold protein